MPKNISLVGTYYEQSHGDALLFDCVKSIFDELGNEHKIDFDFKYVDILGKSKINYDEKQGSTEKQRIKQIIKKIKIIYKPLKKVVQYRRNKKQMKFLKNFYYESFKNSDLIVIVGGGVFKYSVRTDFTPIFKLIIEIAENMNIPVIFNAVGVEGVHNKEDKQFKVLEKAINKDIVKMCSTRDRIDVLEKYIHNPKIICKKVADTGVWTSEALNIKKDDDSNLIGLNLITPTRYWDYGKKITEEELITFWENIIKGLKNKGYSIKIFVNGMIDDYKFALKVIEHCRLAEDILLENPKNEIEMVNNIAKFKGIIANRLHSCIVAYSLNIPAVGLAWNDKLLYWGKEIKSPELFFDFDKMDANEVINSLEEAIGKGYDQQFKENFRKSIYSFLEESIKYIK